MPVPLVSSALPRSGLTDMLLLLYISNRSNSPPRLMAIAHCSQSLLARASPVQPDEAPALCRRGPAELWSQELKNLLQLHPSRTLSTTPSGALWSEATVHPLPTPRGVWLAFVLIHNTDFTGAWSLRAIHLFCSQVLLGNTLLGFPHPSLLAISSLSLAGHFLPLPLNQRVVFPFLKGACNVCCMVLESLD